MVRSRLFWAVAGALLAAYFMDRAQSGRAVLDRRTRAALRRLVESGLDAFDSRVRAALGR